MHVYLYIFICIYIHSYVYIYTYTHQLASFLSDKYYLHKICIDISQKWHFDMWDLAFCPTLS